MMDSTKETARSLDKPEPMESELGFKFQFVDAPSPPKKIKTDHLKIQPSEFSTVSTEMGNNTVVNNSEFTEYYQPEHSLNNLQHKHEVPTVLLGESDDDNDDDGFSIRKNVIIKVSKKTYDETIVRQYSGQTQAPKQVVGKVQESNESTEVPKQLPTLQNTAKIKPEINKKQTTPVNNFKESQPNPPHLLLNKKQFIYYQTPSEPSQKSNSKFLNEVPKLLPLSKALNVQPDEKKLGVSQKNNSQTSVIKPKHVPCYAINKPSQTKGVKATSKQNQATEKPVLSKCPIPANILKNQLVGVQHQVISSGPVILNSPGLVSINNPVRHYIVPSFDQGYKVYNSLDEIGMRQVSQHDNRLSLSQGYTILKPVQKPKEGTVIKKNSNLEPGKSVVVASKTVFKSPMQPLNEPLQKTLFYSNLQPSSTHTTSTDSQPMPTLKVKPLHTLINPASVVKAELVEGEEEYTPVDYPEYVQVSQKSDVTGPRQNITPVNIPGEASEMQSTSMIDPRIRPTYKVKLVKIVDKSAVNSTESAYGLQNSKQISKKRKNNHQCFGTYDWMVSYIPHHYKEFGFYKAEYQPRCLAFLEKNIKELEIRIANKMSKAAEDQEISTSLTKDNVKKTYFNKKKLNTIKRESNQQDIKNDMSSADLTLEDDIPVSYVQDSDSDCELLVTKRVVILKDGSEEESSSCPEQDEFAGWDTQKAKKETDQPIFTPCYVELEKSAVLEKLAAEYREKLEKEKVRKEWFTANWFNSKIVFKKTYYKKWQTNQKPLLIIDSHSLGSANSNYTKFNIIFPTDMVSPENPILKNKRFMNLVRVNNIRLVHPSILSEYFKNMYQPEIAGELK